MSTIRSSRTIDAVLFDLDGTIADTFPTVLRIFNRLMVERTGRIWKLEELSCRPRRWREDHRRNLGRRNS